MATNIFQVLRELAVTDRELLDGVIEAEKDPKNYHIWYRLGKTLSQKQHHSSDIECYDKAIEIDPKNVEAWNNKWYSLESLGENDIAIEMYSDSIFLTIGCQFEDNP
jgi:tetratricopeptide (TPR) repeat protein